VKEVLAAVDDLLVLVVARRLEGRHHLGRARQHRARHQHGRPAHVEDLTAQLAQRAFGAHAGRQGRGGVLQVDGAEALDPPPYRRPEPARLRRHPVDKQQPAPARCLVTIGHRPIVSERRIPAAGSPVPELEVA
jgi:hypothetical protein